VHPWPGDVQREFRQALGDVHFLLYRRKMQAEIDVPSRIQAGNSARIPARITVNGQPRDWRPDGTVADLLASLRLGPRGIAVELNGQIVRSTEYSVRTIEAGAEVEIVTLVGGG
jgi:sulfur carrier protein